MTVPSWLSDAVLYQVYPQSFADSDCDGTGDLRGIAEHLDYLAWLGVTVAWLIPCFVSPMRDAGYDVADYFAIDPRYGTTKTWPTWPTMPAGASWGFLRCVPGWPSCPSWPESSCQPTS